MKGVRGVRLSHPCLPISSWFGLTPGLQDGKGRVPKKNPYFLWSFAKPGGGGSARVVKKPYCFFEKVFFSESM